MICEDGEKKTITITISREDGGIQVSSDVPPGIGNVDDVAYMYMSSLVSLLRVNEITEEEIPDVVREALRSAMLGVSSIEEEAT